MTTLEYLNAVKAKLGIVRGNVIEMAVRRPKKKPQVTDLRLDDFDPIQLAN